MLTGRQHTVLATVLVVIVAYLVRLGSVEIQPGNEGWYAITAEEVLLADSVAHGSAPFFEGAHHAFGSSAGTWSAVGGMLLLGRTSTGVRLGNVVLAGVALLMLYALLRRYCSHWMSVLGVVLCGTSLYWVVFARQATEVIPLVVLMQTSILAWLHIRDVDSRKSSLQMSARGCVLGISAVLCLAINLPIGMLCVLLPLSLLRAKTTRTEGVVALGTVLLLALALVVVANPHSVTAWLANYRSVCGTSARFAITMATPFVSLQRVIATTPIATIGVLVLVFWGAHQLKSLASKSETTAIRSAPMLPSVWFVSVLASIMVCSPTDVQSTALLLPPVILLSVSWFEYALATFSRRTLLLLYGSLIVSCSWTLASTFVEPLSIQTMDALPWIGGVLLLGVIPFVLPKRVADVLVVRNSRFILVLAVIVQTIPALQAIWRPTGGLYVHGGREVAMRMLESGNRSALYLYHGNNDCDSVNTQLAWYTAGWFTGRSADYSYSAVAMPSNSASLDAAAQAAFSGAYYIVYYHPTMRPDIQTQVLAALAVGYRVEFSNSAYTLLSAAHTVK